MILNVIKGYKIPFTYKVRQPVPPPEPRLSKGDKQTVEKLVKDLKDRKVICECRYQKGQFTSLYFHVDKPNGEKRFILSLKKINKFISALHFKIEVLKTVRRLVTKG